MSRFESRHFITHDRQIVKRVVDTLSPLAMIPAGTTITCEAGHEVYDTVEAIQPKQRVDACMIGLPRPFQKPAITNRQLGPCFCGRPFTTWNGKIHTKDGWKPDWK